MEMSRNGVSPHSSAWESQEYGNGFSDVNITGKGAFFPQYKALIIRNITLKIRERRKTLTEFIMPIYFMVILVILRLVIPDNTYPQILTPHGQSDLDSSVLFLQGQALHVTPNNTQIRTIMNEVHFLAKSEGSNIEMYYYETEDDLIHQFVQNQSSITYGVVFSDEPLEDMNYTLRLDPLKTFIPSASNRWTGGQECRQTDPNKGLSVLCAPSGYFYSGFLAIQLLIDTSIIRLTSGIDVPLPSVTLQHFPRDKYTDGGTVALRSIIPLYMVFAWAQFIVYMLMLVVEEKEKKIKESMKMMGLRDSVYWLSWFSIYGTYVLILAIISILILPLGKVLEHANVFLLFILFILYGCSSIMFSFMLTPFFNKAKVAGIAGNLIQVLFSLLYYIQVFVGDDVNSTVYWAMGLLSPCAFSLAIDKVLVLDLDGSGLNFDNMWKGPGLPFAGSLIMISLDIVIYFTLAFYLDNVVPSDYGTKKKPWFIFQKSFWIKEDKDLKLISLSSEDNMGYEEDNITQNSDIEAVASEFRGKIAVRMRHLKKTFHARGKEPIHAVDGISLDIYEDQITAILGHNGAGKTTLFNILTGMTAPTSGSASIFGLDISNTNDLTTIHRITGICPQHDILFMTLTPREHLSFFARIRGIQPENVEDEVQKTLKEVDLLSKADTKGADLSGGQKRKLSIGIALIGDPKIIFLDEPTAGVDAYSRRHLWSLLRNRKKGKVILLTTHFMDEADILADRKAIVSHGRLRCCGSSLFLKNKFGLGYHLTLVVDEESKPDDVTKVLQEAVTDAQFARHYGKEMSYILPSESAKDFPSLFTLLDKHIRKGEETVGIEGYGISMTTLEEVFLALSDENGEDPRSVDGLGQQLFRDKSASLSQKERTSSSLSLKNGTLAKANVNTQKDASGYAIESVEIKRETWRAFKSKLKINMIGLLREPAAIVFLIVFPVVFLVVSILLADMQEFSKPTDVILALNPWTYGNNDALLYNNTGYDLAAIEAVFASDNVTLDSYNGSYSQLYELRPHMSAWYIDDFPDLDMQEVPVNMTLSFNDSFVHSLPILTNLLSNTILSAIGNSSTISILSQMLPQLQGEAKFDVTTFFAPFMIGMTFTIVPCGLAMDIVADREIGVRNMMRLNGVGFHLYFSSSFLVMGAMYIICYISLLIIIAAFNLASLMIPPAFAAIAILYLLYMPVALLYSGVFGYIFDKAETARQFYPSIATTIGMLCYNAVSIVDMTVGVNDNGVSVAKYIHYVVTILFPHYIPFGLLYYINKIYILCSIKGDCSSLTAGDYMTGEIIVMFVMLLIDIPLYYILLRLADTLKLGGSWREALWIKSPPPNMSKESGIDAPTNEDDDVIAERAAVSASLMNGGEVSPAIIYDLGKAYKAPDKKENPCKPSKKKEKEFVALKSVSLEVKAGQVFGLLGPNGAGKTTSLRIMTAQEKPSKGRVQICGKEIVSSLSEVFANLGYCPQHDALWRNITVAEHIQVLADIRGVREDQVKPLIAAFLKGLEIEEHGAKYSQDCSGGTKRKLSYIMSMLGSPKVVLLDEPSTGMDPQSKRFLWDSILASFKGERSAILTTHSMEEADALCSRIGILVRGGLRCIGAIQHLKNKYGGGYTLEIKLNLQAGSRVQNLESIHTTPNSLNDTSLQSPVNTDDQVKHLVMDTFPNAILDEEFEERLMYKIPQSDVTSLSSCFVMLEKAKSEGLVLEYALSQTTLEQVFLQFARQQEEGDTIDEEDVAANKSNLISEL